MTLRQALRWALVLVLAGAAGAASAQRHDTGSSPPTAPPSKTETPHPVLASPPSMGALAFLTDNIPVPDPESLAAQMRAADDLTRADALVAVGAPAWYLEQGPIPTPHSVRLDLLPLGDSRTLDAILTVELEHHIVSAVLIPVPAQSQGPVKSSGSDPLPRQVQWRRIATLTYPANFGNPSAIPRNFLITNHSLLNPLRYTAVFHTITYGPNRNFKEAEVHLQVLAGHALITAGVTSSQRSCDDTHPHHCQIIQRWLQPDASDPRHRFLLVTATAYAPRNQPGSPISHARIFADSHQRTFICQPFSFSSATLHFEPLASPSLCFNPHDNGPDQPLH